MEKYCILEEYSTCLGNFPGKGVIVNSIHPKNGQDQVL